MELKGWKYIVYQIIKNNFSNGTFSLKDLYDYETSFKGFYPNNYHIKDKLRQQLQYLRDKGFIKFISPGKYELNQQTHCVEEINEQIVYLLSNPSIPDWIKIGKTKDIDQRLIDLSNTSVPLKFKLENSLSVSSETQARILEKTIHELIDTINPALRKDTEANRREFFKMSIEQGNQLFALVARINNIELR